MNKYVYKPYNPIFPQLFEKEKERIALHVQNIIAIEHIGSTAVPNLGGKGIIDIAIAVQKENMEGLIPQLQNLGYEFRKHFSTSDRLYFVINLPDIEEGTRRYHVHVTYVTSKVWKEFINFRDYLRTHSQEREEYAAMKQVAVAANHIDDEYRKIKEPMFKKILSFLDKE